MCAVRVRVGLACVRVRSELRLTWVRVIVILFSIGARVRE